MYKDQGVYLIISKVHPERVYVGSSVNCSNRFKRHINELKNNKHGNQKLQNHFNKYRIHDFIFLQILICDRKELLHEEQKVIDNINPFFNICKKAGSRLGTKQSLTTRKKMRVKWQDRRRIAWYFKP